MRLFVLRSVASLCACCTLCSLPAHAQKSAGAQPGSLAGEPAQDGLPAAEIARRDSMLDPGLAKLKAGDNAGAYDALRPVLLVFPHDLRVLRYSAQAAELTGHDEEAVDLFTRALAEHPTQPWPIRLGRMQAEARLARWPVFDADLAALREAKKANDSALAKSNGFVIDEFHVGASNVQAMIFPLLAGHFHTLYRFILPSAANAAVSASTNSPTTGADGKPSPCAANMDFHPYIDVESDDVDQVAFAKAHADKAAHGERSYSLDTYPAPCSQGLIRFYNDGEPSYETVRGEVLKLVAAHKTPADTQKSAARP